jgi:hypothetical protein
MPFNPERHSSNDISTASVSSSARLRVRRKRGLDARADTLPSSHSSSSGEIAPERPNNQFDASILHQEQPRQSHPPPPPTHRETSPPPLPPPTFGTVTIPPITRGGFSVPTGTPRRANRNTSPPRAITTTAAHHPPSQLTIVQPPRKQQATLGTTTTVEEVRPPSARLRSHQREHAPPSVRVSETTARETTIRVDTRPFFASPPLPNATTSAATYRSQIPHPAATVRPPVAVAPSPRHHQQSYQPVLNMPCAPVAPTTSASSNLVMRAPSQPPPSQSSYNAYYASMTPDQREEARQKFIEKFLILRRHFPTWSIPLPSEDASLEQVHRLYESYVKHVTIQSNQTHFKIALVVMFVAIEYAASRFGISLAGYAEFQIKSMSKYDAVLLELGAKYASDGSGGEWPVEARIVFIAVVQAVIFFVAKYIEKLIGIPSAKVHTMIDGAVESFTGGEDGETTDAQGLPIAPGTEAEIKAVDTTDPEVAAAVRAAGSSAPPRAAPSQATDLGAIMGGLGGLLSGGGGSGGGIDVANLIGVASKFISQSPNDPSGAKSPLSAAIGALTGAMAGGGSPTSPTAATSAQQKTSPRRSGAAGTSPQSKPRRTPVFSE